LFVSANVRNSTELPSCDPALELLPDMGIRGFSHAARERRFQNRAAVLYSRSLEDMIARPGHGPLRLHLRLLYVGRQAVFVSIPLIRRLGA
jgi:hypothetical protein